METIERPARRASPAPAAGELNTALVHLYRGEAGKALLTTTSQASAESRRPSAPAVLGFMVLVALTLVVQSVGTLPPLPVPAPAPIAPNLPAATNPLLGVIGSNSAGQLILRFVPMTKPAEAQRRLARLGMHLVNSSPALGQYVFDPPQVAVAPYGQGQALLEFPAASTAADVAKYMSDNHLVMVRWLRNSSAVSGDELTGRLAIVTLPKIALTPLDAAAGTLQGVIPQHLDQNQVTTWAQGSGLQLLTYDPNTGAVTLQGPKPAPAPAIVNPSAAAQLANLINQIKSASQAVQKVTNHEPTASATTCAPQSHRRQR